MHPLPASTLCDPGELGLGKVMEGELSLPQLPLSPLVRRAEAPFVL